MTDWKPIETAPKGGGADFVTDPNWVEPPKIIVCCEDGEIVIVYWDWAYARDGYYYNPGLSAWILQGTGEQVGLHYGEPTHWMPLPPPPQTEEGSQ